MLSFIIPAHNEEHWIAACLKSIYAAMQNIAAPYELIVVDDASTDATANIAHEQATGWLGSSETRAPSAVGTGLQCLRVLRVNLRKISAVRNAGAAVATGDILFFIDADTQANEPAIRAALVALEAGAAGGGCVPEFVGHIPFWARIIIWFAVTIARRIRLVGGCFQFCTREAFKAIGGFNEDLRAGEDMAFCQAIKKVGRFVVPGPTVVTSARKLNVVSPGEISRLLVMILIHGPRYESTWIIDILYGPRAQAARTPTEASDSAATGPASAPPINHPAPDHNKSPH
jgi:glycosyltransferase involved in cell wall biosynthesis